jgi:hypothetical protein
MRCVGRPAAKQDRGQQGGHRRCMRAKVEHAVLRRARGRAQNHLSFSLTRIGFDAIRAAGALEEK